MFRDEGRLVGRAVAYPDYADYQTKTDRQIPGRPDAVQLIPEFDVLVGPTPRFAPERTFGRLEGRVAPLIGVR